jgi:hypothetical protein
VKSADPKFGNDHILDMANFRESSRWMAEATAGQRIQFRIRG